MLGLQGGCQQFWDLILYYDFVCKYLKHAKTDDDSNQCSEDTQNYDIYTPNSYKLCDQKTKLCKLRENQKFKDSISSSAQLHETMYDLGVMLYGGIVSRLSLLQIQKVRRAKCAQSSALSIQPNGKALATRVFAQTAVKAKALN